MKTKSGHDHIAGTIAQATSFCEKIAATITRKLATALRDLHAAGVIHRDIKPGKNLCARVRFAHQRALV